MNSVYLPAIMTDDPLNRFGAQIEGPISDDGYWIKSDRIYQIPIQWNNFNTNQEQYDANIALIRSKGGRMALGIRCVPVEHRLWPEYAGSPPKPTSYDALADWVIYVCNRYHPEYVELFNEPNVGREVTAGCLYGAWILSGEDVQLSGRRYGSMLRAVYPKVKATGARVYAGALMMNNYWEDFLRGMADAPADAISWHCYLHPETPFTYLDDTIQRFRAITTNILAITETSVLDENDSPELRQIQKSWFEYLVSSAELYDLSNVLWYTLIGNEWLNSDLVHNSDPNTPAYLSFCGR